MSKFNTEDYWKAIILYGLNASTYKIALGKTLINFAKNKTNTVSWEELSKEFLNQYLLRLNQDNPMPQLSNPKRRTVMEKIILQLNDNQITTNEAIKQVGDNAFEDVIPRFHMLGKLKTDGLFYKFIHGESLILTDELMTIVENSEEELNSEVDSRWNLLEGAFYARFSNDNYVLGNDILKTYLKNGDNHRKNLTGNIPFYKVINVIFVFTVLSNYYRLTFMWTMFCQEQLLITINYGIWYLLMSTAIKLNQINWLAIISLKN